jgi:glucokinase
MILVGDIGGAKVNLSLYNGKRRAVEKRYESRNFSCVEGILTG